MKFNKRKWQRILLTLASSALLFTLWIAGAVGEHQISHAAPAPPPSEIDGSNTVVINEIAWSGTSASSADEWIELYNTTPATVTLDNWLLYASDGGPSITLSGDIGPYGYYLIERTDDNTISDINADLVIGFGSGLGNSGEVITLETQLNIVVDTANTVDGISGWVSGSASPDYYTMERVDPLAVDTPDNWVSNDGQTINGQDANASALNATPRARNSNYQPSFAESADLSVLKSGPAEAGSGEVITYYLSLENVGGNTAAMTILSDTLPAEVTFIAQDSGYLFTQTDQILEWQLNSVATGTHTIITVTGQVSDTASGEIYNTITATTSTTEPHTLNNSATWTTTVQTAIADLAIQKSGLATITAGNTITYYLEIANNGSIPAVTTLLTDTLPAGVTFSTQSGPFSFNDDGQILSWDIGEFAAGASARITVTGLVSNTLADITITNTVTATSLSAESSLLNNVDNWGTAVEALPGEINVLISGVLYDGYQGSDNDEAVQLINVGADPVEMDAWQLCKDVSGSFNCRVLPTITLAPDQRIWLAKNSAAFSISFGYAPDYELASWISSGLSNNGDEVALRDQDDTLIDVIVYKGGQNPFPGWTGAALQPYAGGREAGQILYRIPDEKTGLPITDTNSAVDWMQSSENLSYGRRVLYPGWDLDPLFFPQPATETASVMVGVAPDNAFEVVSETLMRAQESILVEIYAFRHPDLIKVLLEKAEAGVKVTMLLEGDPVGIGINDQDWQTELWLCQKLEETGNGQCWFMINDSDATPKIYNRYKYIHAKFVIVDDTWTMVASQNFTLSSIPSDDKTNGTYGSRGTVIATDAASVVARAKEIFQLDLGSGEHNDILRWDRNNTGDQAKYGLPSVPPDLGSYDGVTYTVQFTQPLVTNGTFDFALVSSPETSLRQSDSLLGLVNRAGENDSIYTEQLYEYADWGDSPESDPNTRLEAYIEAARRGAKVRILVNGKSFSPYGGEVPESRHTITYVNQIAALEHLDLEAAMGDLTGSGIHNKMVLINLHDDQGYVHVGSLNGSEGSHILNRELAIQIGSDEIYDYLAEVFEFDWWQSHPIYLPLIMRNLAPPEPPVEYMLISEVYYRGSAEAEWVEIYNPTDFAIDLSQYKLGDAEVPTAFEAMYQFPPGTIIESHGVFVIAVNAVEVLKADFEFYNTSPTVPDMVNYVPWGSAEYPFSLRNTGDQVLLLGPTDITVDALVWGDQLYPGIVAHPGVSISISTLERYPPYYDTNDCTIDFVERTPGTPGEIPEVTP